LSKRTPIFWVYGNFRQCRQTWDDIVERSTFDKQKPNIQVMFSGINSATATASQRWSTADDLIFTLRNRDVCDDRPRIIKVCGLPELYTDLADWFHVIDGSNILVIQSPFGYIKPGSKRWVTAKNSKFFKKVKAEGFLVDHPVEAKNESDAVDWVTNLAQESKKEIKNIVAREIVAKEGINLDKLTNAVEKLCVYQRKKELKIEDVHECCSGGFLPETVWQFLSDLDRRRDERSLAYLQAFYAEGDGAVGESFYGRINKLFGALVQHFQFLLVIKDACNNRELNMQIIEDALDNFKKTTPTKILELRRKEISFEDLEPRFSKGYIGNNIKKDNIRFAFQKKKSETYRNLLALHNCIYLCRLNSGNDYLLRLYLDTFALIVCGRLTYQEAKKIHGDV